MNLLLKLIEKITNMPILFFLFFLFPLSDVPERILLLEDKGLSLEIVEENTKDSKPTGDYRKLLVSKKGKLMSEVLLQRNRGDFGYEIFDHYADDKSCFVVIGGYDQFYIYDLQSFTLSSVVKMCQKKYCELIDAQSCSILNIKINENGKAITIEGRDCKEIVMRVEDIIVE